MTRQTTQVLLITAFGLLGCAILAVGAWLVHAEARAQTAALLAAARAAPAPATAPAPAAAPAPKLAPVPISPGTAREHALALSRESNPTVRVWAVHILGELVDPGIEADLAVLLQDPREEVRRAVLDILYNRRSPMLVKLAKEQLADGQLVPRRMIAELLCRPEWTELFKDDELIGLVAARARDLPDGKDNEVRRTRAALITVLGQRERADLCQAIAAAALATTDATAHTNAAAAFALSATAEEAPLVADTALALWEKAPKTAYGAVGRMVQVVTAFPPDQRCLEALGRLMVITHRYNRWYDDCLRSLLALGDQRAAPYLAELSLRKLDRGQLATQLKKQPFPGLVLKGTKVALADAAAQAALEKRIAEEIAGPKGADDF